MDFTHYLSLTDNIFPQMVSLQSLLTIIMHNVLFMLLCYDFLFCYDIWKSVLWAGMTISRSPENLFRFILKCCHFSSSTSIRKFLKGKVLQVLLFMHSAFLESRETSQLLIFFLWPLSGMHNNIDPLGQPRVMDGSDHCFSTCCPYSLFSSSKTKQQKTMVATVGLAEWIIDDTCLVTNLCDLER